MTRFESHRRRRARMRLRFRQIPFRVLLPNLVTLLATCSGLTAIRLAFEGRFELAVYAVLLAALLDAVDGRLARLLKGTSRFGAELDSLSDFVNFGVVPGLILYFFALKDFRSLGWIVALLFAIAAALRLARFNVMLDDPDRPAWKENFFVGIPAPAGALCALLPIYLHFIGLGGFPGFGLLSLLLVLAIAAMMVSRVPTYAGKTLGQRVPRDLFLPVLAGIVFFFLALATYPFEMLTILTLVYLALIPVGIQRYRALEAAARPVPAALPDQDAQAADG